MPTYQYACTECGEPLEVVQKFTDAALTECPACGGRLRKVFSAAAIVFKGSGFYRNDSRDSKPSKSGANGSAKSDGKTDTKSEGGSNTESKSSSESSSSSSGDSGGSGGSGGSKSKSSEKVA